MNDNRNTFYRILFIGAVLLPGLLLFGVAQFGQAAQDAILTVNSADDAVDGICDEVHCSLREAIEAANAEGGAGTIVFSLLPDTTIVLTGIQLPTITETLTIDGSTAVDLIIDGNGRRIFEIRSGVEVTITTMTLVDGGGHPGGAIYNDGGILNIHNSKLLYNESGSGGAIANWEGTLNISDSSVSGNLTYLSGGGLYNYKGVVNIIRTLFYYNWSYGEGAIGGGGAVANEGGVLNISNSTFADNTCFHYRGPCYGAGIANIGQLNLTNSTISGNYSQGYPGPQGGGVANYSFDAYFGTMNFSNNIIANNSDWDCVANSIGNNVNNLVRDGSCSPAISGDPLLRQLEDNGGPTRTFAISPISPAVDKGDSNICADPPVDNLDQRGVERPMDGDGDGVGQCDIGAYEYDGPPPRRFYLPLILNE